MRACCNHRRQKGRQTCKSKNKTHGLGPDRPTDRPRLLKPQRSIHAEPNPGRNQRLSGGYGLLLCLPFGLLLVKRVLCWPRYYANGAVGVRRNAHIYISGGDDNGRTDVTTTKKKKNKGMRETSVAASSLRRRRED